MCTQWLTRLRQAVSVQGCACFCSLAESIACCGIAADRSARGISAYATRRAPQADTPCNNSFSSVQMVAEPVLSG